VGGTRSSAGVKHPSVAPRIAMLVAEVQASSDHKAVNEIYNHRICFCCLLRVTVNTPSLLIVTGTGRETANILAIVGDMGLRVR